MSAKTAPSNEAFGSSGSIDNWVGRWREDVIGPVGVTRRIERNGEAVVIMNMPANTDGNAVVFFPQVRCDR